MKKFNFLFSLASLLAMVFTTTSCEPNSVGDVTPTVMLTAGSATQNTITFTVETSATQKAYYLVVNAADEVAVDGMKVVTEGVEILKEDGSAWVNGAASVTVKDLAPETSYLVYAAAVNGPETTLVDAPLEMTTADKSMPTISVEAVEAEDTTLYFRVASTLAEEVKWLVVAADTEVDAAKVLAEGTALEAKNVNKTVVVKAENLSDDTAYDIYAVAKAESRIVLSTSVTMRTLLSPPTVELSLVEVSDVSANVQINTTLAEEIKWAYAPHGYEGVTAELVYEVGTTAQVVDEQVVVVKGLSPETSYDVYAVAKRGEYFVLSTALVVTTTAPAQVELPELFASFEVPTLMDPAQHGIGGFFYLTLESETGNLASLPIYDLTGASWLDGYYPVVAAPTGAESQFIAQVDPNVGAACFVINGQDYYLMQGEDETGYPYGIQFLTTMAQGQDLNQITLNLLLGTVDDNGELVPAAKLVGDCYLGPLGYSGMSMPKTERDLSTFNTFKMTVSEDGNFVTLKGSNYMGDLTLEFVTAGAPIAGADGSGVNYSIEQGTLSGIYWEPLDDWTFVFKQGNLFVEKVEGKEDTYLFTMSSRRGGLVAEMSNPQPLQVVFSPLDVAWEVTITK